MVANKRDLNTQIAVDHDELVAFTERHNFLYKEVSAKTGDGVIDMFDSLFYKAIEKKYGIHINPNYYEPKIVFTRRKGV